MSSIYEKISNDEGEVQRCSRPGCLEEALMLVRGRAGKPSIDRLCKRHALQELLPADGPRGEFFGHICESQHVRDERRFQQKIESYGSAS
jgi:hypothetical protein